MHLNRFELVSGVDRGMGVLDVGENGCRGKGSFGDKHGASHCNQRELCGVIITLGFLVVEISTMIHLYMQTTLKVVFT